MSSGGILDNQFYETQAGAFGSYGLSFTLMGEAATYTAVGTPGVDPVSTSLYVIRVPTPDVIERDTDEKTKFLVSTGDISSPTEDDYITDDAGLVWHVERVAPQAGGCHLVTCVNSKDQ